MHRYLQSIVTVLGSAAIWVKTIWVMTTKQTTNVLAAIAGVIILASGFMFMIRNDARYATRDELAAYVNDPAHGLRIRKVTGNVAVEITYRPAALVGEAPSKARSAETDSLAELYAHYHYFILSLSCQGHEVLQPALLGNAYSEILQTLSFRMADYVTLTAQGDTLALADYRLEHTFGLAPTTDLLLAFKKHPTERDWLQFDLAEFGLGIGQQTFRIKTAALRRIPSIRKDDN